MCYADSDDDDDDDDDDTAGEEVGEDDGSNQQDRIPRTMEADWASFTGSGLM